MELTLIKGNLFFWFGVQAVATAQELIHGGAATLWSPQQRKGFAD